MNDTITPPPRFLNERQAAEYLCLSKNTLRNSRCVGMLGGRPAPPFRRIGTKVVYEFQSLNEWLDENAPVRKHTAE